MAMKMTHRVGRITREGHHAHTRMASLRGGNPMANGGNMGTGRAAPRARRGGAGVGRRRRSSY